MRVTVEKEYEWKTLFFPAEQPCILYISRIAKAKQVEWLLLSSESTPLFQCLLTSIVGKRWHTVILDNVQVEEHFDATANILLGVVQ